MNPLERIRNELKSHPNLRYIDQPDSITVFPVSRNGFTVNIKEMNRIFIVSFNGLRQVFLKNNNGAEYALKMFRFGLSESCRLLVHSTGSRELKWEIEYRDYELNQWV